MFILVLSSDNEPQRVNSCLLVLLLSFRRFIARRGKGVCKYLRPLDHVSLANVSLNYLTLLSDIRPVRKKLARAQIEHLRARPDAKTADGNNKRQRPFNPARISRRKVQPAFILIRHSNDIIHSPSSSLVRLRPQKRVDRREKKKPFLK